MLLVFLVLGLLATALSFLVPAWRKYELWPYTVLMPLVAATTWQLILELLVTLYARFSGDTITFNFGFPGGLIVVLICSVPGATLALLFVRWLRRDRRSATQESI